MTTDRSVLQPFNMLPLPVRLCPGAVLDFGAAIAVEPRYADSWKRRGQARSALNDYEGALSDLQKAIDLLPLWQASGRVSARPLLLSVTCTSTSALCQICRRPHVLLAGSCLGECTCIAPVSVHTALCVRGRLLAELQLYFSLSPDPV